MTDRGIPKWIKEELVRRDWTAADLSRRTGVGTGRISEWMNGHRRPSPDSCHVLADAFGVDPDDVLFVAGYRIAPTLFDANDAGRRIVSLLQRVHLTHERIRVLEATLEAYWEIDRRKAAISRFEES